MAVNVMKIYNNVYWRQDEIQTKTFYANHGLATSGYCASANALIPVFIRVFADTHRELVNHDLIDCSCPVTLFEF